MKQHITPEQLNELSGKAMEKLLWWTVDDKDYDIKTLSIGQMIEFLGKEWVDKLAIIGTRDLDNPFYLSETHKLCDALWEAVKEVLES